MFTDETLQRAEAYNSRPVRHYPTLIEALSAINVAYITDMDILDNMEFLYYHGKGDIPYFRVSFHIKPDVASELITLQHSKLF